MIDSALLDAMIAAPTDHFETPLAVTADQRLSHGQKEAVLLAWVATCRKDLGDHSGRTPAGLGRAYLQEVERALGRLAELRSD